jgi:hypothetical protein
MKTKKYIFKPKRSLNYRFTLYCALIGGIIIAASVNSCGHQKTEIHNDHLALIHFK